MTSIDLHLDGDNCWPEIRDAFLVAELTGIALLPDASVVDTFTGQQKKKPALTLRIELPDGQTALAMVKVEMLEMALRAVKGRLEYIAELKAKGGADS